MVAWHGRQRHRRRRAVGRRRPVRARCRSRSSKDYELPGLRRRAHAGLRRLVLGQHRGDRRGASPKRPRSARTSSLSAQGGELARLAADWGRTGAAVPGRHPDAPCRASARSLSRRSLALEHIGLFPGARGWIRPPSSSSRGAATSSSAAGNPAEALARRIGRTIPLVYGGGPIGARGRHAVEVPGQRERQGARLLQPGARAVPQRGGGMGPARRRDPPGAHARRPPPRLRAPAGGPPVRAR